MPSLFARLAAGLAVLSAACGAAAQDMPPVLSDFLDGLETLSARFEQTVGLEGQESDQVSRGTLQILRPGRFRWDYETPSRQLVVSDGSRLWLYDPDLEQVTVRDLDETLSSTPAMLLGGEGVLTDHFRAGATYDEDGFSWIELVPIAKDSDFTGLRVGFCGQLLCAMELLDKLGQYTRILFSDMDLGAPVDPAVFEFEVPDGADVISESDF
jgi:outer membrane lipoprotein carrier protein